MRPVDRDMPYDEAARGRVNYEDASGRFTLFTDRCIIRSKRLVSKIMNELRLPKDTRVLADDHYQSRRALPRVAGSRRKKIGTSSNDSQSARCILKAEGNP